MVKFNLTIIQLNRPDTEIILSDLNFSIESGNKVGIVGRTGSGKSLITLCLFRILEA